MLPEAKAVLLPFTSLPKIVASYNNKFNPTNPYKLLKIVLQIVRGKAKIVTWEAECWIVIVPGPK
jgi:hypothetical protein